MIAEFHQGEFRFIELTNRHYELLVSAYGARAITLTSKATGVDLLWLSSKNPLVKGKSLVGGLASSILFGSDPAQMRHAHFLDQQQWYLKGDKEDKDLDQVAITLSIRHQDFHKEIWPYAFELELSLQLSGNHLECEVVIFNHDVRPFYCDISFSPALSVEHRDQIQLIQEDSHYSLVDSFKHKIVTLEQEEREWCLEKLEESAQAIALIASSLSPQIMAIAPGENYLESFSMMLP